MEDDKKGGIIDGYRRGQWSIRPSYLTCKGGGLWPTPDSDKFCWAIWCNGECGKELVHYLKTTKLFREMKVRNK